MNSWNACKSRIITANHCDYRIISSWRAPFPLWKTEEMSDVSSPPLSRTPSLTDVARSFAVRPDMYMGSPVTFERAHHPEDAKFVPDGLPEPNPINMSAGGFMDVEFDGEPWFGRSETREN